MSSYFGVDDLSQPGSQAKITTAQIIGLLAASMAGGNAATGSLIGGTGEKYNSQYDNEHAAQKEARKEDYEERLALGEMPTQAEIDEFGHGITPIVPGVPIAGGLGIGTGVSKNINSVADVILYANRIGSGLKDDPSHIAASYLTRDQLTAGQTFNLRGNDGVDRTLLQTPGGFNGSQGFMNLFLIRLEM